MRIGRSLPPAAAPIGPREFLSGLRGVFQGEALLKAFCQELSDHFKVKHCFVVSSGKAAFTLILLALKELFPEKDEVVIPAFTCYSVPSSVMRAGLRIRCCDLHPDTLDLDIEQLSVIISGAMRSQHDEAFRSTSTGRPQWESTNNRCAKNRTIGKLLAVVPTHLYGLPSDVREVRKLIQDKDVTVVEDAAQAMGELWRGEKLGTLGDVGFFSLGRGKALSTVEGGIILTNRDDIARILSQRVDRLPGHGIWGGLKLVMKAAGMMIFNNPWLFWFPRCLPFLRLGETLFERNFAILRMSSFQAGLAKNWRERLQKLHEVRAANVRRWLQILGETEADPLYVGASQSLGLLRLPISVREIDRKESLLKEGAGRGAGVAAVYPASINKLPQLKGEIEEQSCPVGERRARELVTLPTHGYLTGDDIEMIRRLLSDASLLKRKYA